MPVPIVPVPIVPVPVVPVPIMPVAGVCIGVVVVVPGVVLIVPGMVVVGVVWAIDTLVTPTVSKVARKIWEAFMLFQS